MKSFCGNTASLVEMEIGNSLRYLWSNTDRSDEIITRFLLGGMIIILGPLLIPQFLLVGYVIRVIRATVVERNEVPSFMTDISGLLVDGVKGYIIWFVYAVIATLVLSGGAIQSTEPGVLSGSLVGLFLIGPFGTIILIIASSVVPGIGEQITAQEPWIVYALLMYMMPAALANYADKGTIRSGFSYTGFDSGIPRLLRSPQYFIRWVFIILFISFGTLLSFILSYINYVIWTLINSSEIIIVFLFTFLIAIATVVGCFINFMLIIAAYVLVGESWRETFYATDLDSDEIRQRYASKPVTARAKRANDSSSNRLVGQFQWFNSIDTQTVECYVIGTFLTMFSILVIPALFVTGYFIRLLHETTSTQIPPRPFSNWFNLAKIGVKTYVLWLLYILFPASLALTVWFLVISHGIPIFSNSINSTISNTISFVILGSGFPGGFLSLYLTLIGAALMSTILNGANSEITFVLGIIVIPLYISALITFLVSIDEYSENMSLREGFLWNIPLLRLRNPSYVGQLIIAVLITTVGWVIHIVTLTIISMRFSPIERLVMAVPMNEQFRDILLAYINPVGLYWWFWMLLGAFIFFALQLHAVKRIIRARYLSK